jgi:AcrR family transcriptional regulator
MEQGANVTSRQLAAAAGVSEGTIFNAFGDKEALLAAAFEAGIDPGPFERAVAAIDGSAPLEQRLAQAVGLLQQRIANVWRLITQIGHCQSHRPRPLPDSPTLAALLGSAPGRLRLEPVEAARLLRSLTFASTHPLLAPSPRTADEIVELFLHGVDARP